MVLTGETEIDVLAESAVEVAEGIEAKLIVALTDTGTAARAVASLKPEMYTICASGSELTLAQSAFSFGVYPFKVSSVKDSAVALKEIKAGLTKDKTITKGDKIVVVDEKALSLSIVTA
jgi:pyruvate kinase